MDLCKKQRLKFQKEAGIVGGVRRAAWNEIMAMHDDFLKELLRQSVITRRDQLGRKIVQVEDVRLAVYRIMN